jgi:MFS family permease
MKFTKHPLIVTLKNLRGNVRACVYTEPLWGIPYNLYAPYASVYMRAFSLTDSQIGSITSFGLVSQIFWAMLSGAITDKLGRKRTTLIFDIIAWSVPCLIWAISQNFTYFLIAAIINGVFRVTHNSWNCLLVEDADPRHLVDVYSWVYISGLLAAFVSPFTGLFIKQFTLIPTIRGVYLLSLVMMTAKFVVLNVFATETKQGLIRMQATQHQSLMVVFHESLAVLKLIRHAPLTLFTAGLMVILSICMLIYNIFWAILVTEKLQIPAQHLAYYPFARSITMLLFFFLAMPRLQKLKIYTTMTFGLGGLILSQIMLISIPPRSYGLLLIATIIEACSIPATYTLLDKLTVVTVDAKERARILAILNVLVLVCTSPFGWIAGQLSEVNRNLPFILSIGLFSLAGLLTFLASRWAKE